MSTTIDYTLSSQNTEFITRTPDGKLGLFRRVDGIETITPIRPTVQGDKKTLLIGHEPCGPQYTLTPKPIQINWPGGQISYLAVQDGIYHNPETDEWEVWLDGEAVAWCGSEKQANRSMSELLGEAY